MPIDVNAAAGYYSQGTQANAGKWQQKAGQAAQDWERNAKSPAAEQFWKERVIEAANNSQRLKGLQKVTSADYANGIQNGGSAYQMKTGMAGGKWANNFSPYATTIDRVVATLPQKTNDVRANVNNRVAPLAEALRNQKTGARSTSIATPAPYGVRR